MQLRRPRPDRDQSIDEEPVKAKESPDKVAEIDEMLAEIDDVLAEVEAESFVKAFVQKGGE